MRKLGIALLFSLGLVTVSLGETGIEANALLGHIKFLASDDLKGRANGSEGLERAGDYVAQQFKGAGLAPGEGAEGWFQPFELIAGLTVGRGNSLSFEYQGKKAAFVLGTSYYPLTAPGDNSPSAQLQHVPLVFAGYGIAVRDVGYDDYAGIDVNGKAVLIFSHEPQEHDTNSRLNGVRPMPQTSLVAKATLARSKGARALFVVSDPSHRVDEGQFSVFNGDPDAEDVGFPFPVVRVRRTE